MPTNDKYHGNVIYNEQSRYFSAFITELPEVTVQGRSVQEVKERLNLALKYVNDYNASSISFSDVETFTIQ